MAGRNFSISVLIRAIDRVTAPVARAQKAIDRLTQPIRRVTNKTAAIAEAAGLDRITDKLSSVSRGVHGVGDAALTSARRVAALTAGVGALAYGFNSQFLNPADTLQRMSISLDAIEGSKAGAKKALDWIKTFDLKSPFNFTEIMESFRMMRAADMDPMGGQLQALSDYTAKLGGTSETLMSIARQLRDARSKEKLQQQDVRVMAEHGVNAWGLLQRAIERVSKGARKVTIPQLVEMASQGQIGLKGITLLMEQMGVEGRGAAEGISKTWFGMMSGLMSRWFYFKADVAGWDFTTQAVRPGSPLSVLQARLGGLLETIDRMTADGSLDRLITKWSKSISDFFGRALDGIPKLIDVLRRVGSVADRASQMFGGWENLMKIGLAAYIGGPLVGSVFSLVGAIAALNIALGATPAGWVILAIAGIVAAMFVFVAKWGDIKAGWDALWTGLKDTVRGFLKFVTGDFGEGFVQSWKGVGAVLYNAISPVLWLFEKAWELAGKIGGGIHGGIRSLFTDAPESSSAPGRPFANNPFLRAPWNFSGPTGPSLAPSRALAPNRASREPATSVSGRLEVDFRNMPRGARVTADPKSSIPIDLSLGYALADGF